MGHDDLDALKPLFDCLVDGVCVADSGGRLLYANAAAGRMLGTAVAEAAEGSVCAALCGKLVGAEAVAGPASCPLRTERGPGEAVTTKGRHGPGRRDLRVRCLRVRLPRSERHFLLIEDATAETRARREREAWRQMLVHDLRAPLTIAKGALRLVEDMGTGHALDEEEVGLARSGVGSCRRMEALVDSYLETERLLSGDIEVKRAPVDAARLARALTDEHRVLARERGLTLTCAAPEALIVQADEDLLSRALANLIDNALKFTPEGGRVEVSAARAGEGVSLRVRDDGPGIAANELDAIFERFHRGSAAPRRRGLGLGLTYCRAALRAMGGDVTVESAPGRGSVFALVLPDAKGATP